MLKLKYLSIERLASVHGVDSSIDSNMELQRVGSVNRKVKMTIYLQYIWRIMLFFIIAASYYLLIYCYLYPICESSMLYRPHLLSNFISRRLLVVRLSLISKEIYYNYNYQKIPELYPFKNSVAAQDAMIGLLKLQNKEIRHEKYAILMSSDLRERVYETIDSQLATLKQGSEASTADLMFDIETLIYWVPSIIDIKKFDYQVDLLLNEIAEEFKLADKDSIDVINRQLDTIVNTTVIYSIAVCALFFLYYLPYLNYQIGQLKRFSVLPSILPADLDHGRLY
ncbi:unnamed protein product [Blepharisma stoltei]|uniref:Uncharacterized protein n=1 Tax=Blepharisma stoltei TaxID=1481888 RepID=A0AAU9INE2_9CILI|nr:unnamed protein product [Blepharisma stoltei]